MDSRITFWKIFKLSNARFAFAKFDIFFVDSNKDWDFASFSSSWITISYQDSFEIGLIGVWEDCERAWKD